MTDSNSKVDSKVDEVNKLLIELEKILFGLEKFKEEDVASDAKNKGIEFHKGIYNIKLRLFGAVEQEELKPIKEIMP